MARIREYRVGDADEGGHEVARQRYGGDSVRRGIGACGGHSDDAGDQDAEGAKGGKPRESVEGAGDGEEEGGDGEDSGIEHKAQGIGRGQSAQSDLTSQKLGAGTANSEDDGAPGKDLTADGTEKNEAGVAHAMN